MKVVLRADVSAATYDKVAIISGLEHLVSSFSISFTFEFVTL